MRKLTRSEIYAKKRRIRQMEMLRTGEDLPTVLPLEWYEARGYIPQTLKNVLTNREAQRQPRAQYAQILICPLCNWQGRGLKWHMRSQHWLEPHYEVVEKLTTYVKSVEDTNKYNAMLKIIEMFSKTAETQDLPRLMPKAET